MALLEACADTAGGQYWFVEGESGSGKTRLALLLVQALVRDPKLFELGNRCFLYDFSDADTVQDHLLRRAGALLPAPTQPIVSLGGTDTRFWRAKGVPAFVYGCSPAGMGSVDESVSLAEFHHVIKVHALAAWDYLKAAS